MHPGNAVCSRRDVGSIIAHAVTVEEKEADYWSFFVPGGGKAGDFPHRDVHVGYLYDVREKGVTHACDIDWIRPRSAIGYGGIC